MALIGYEVALKCRTCGQPHTVHVRSEPDDEADYHCAGPCGHDAFTIQDVYPNEM